MKNLYYKFLFFILFLLTFVVCNNTTNVFAMTGLEADFIIKTFNLTKYQGDPSSISTDKLSSGEYYKSYNKFYYKLKPGDALKIKNKTTKQGWFDLNGKQELVGYQATTEDDINNFITKYGLNEVKGTFPGTSSILNYLGAGSCYKKDSWFYFRLKQGDTYEGVTCGSYKYAATNEGDILKGDTSNLKFSQYAMGTVTILQEQLTGRASSSNLCAFDNLLQNCGKITDSNIQCNGTISDSNKSKWDNYEKSFVDSGCAGGEFTDSSSGKKGRQVNSTNKQIEWLNKSTSGGWSAIGTGGKLEGSDEEYKFVESAVVAFGNKDFKDMSYSEVVTIMKLFYNNGYFVIFGLKVGGDSGQGPTEYKGGHVVLMAGMDETDIYINDSLFGTVNKYTENYSVEGGTEPIMWILPIKNEETSTMKICGGGTIGVTESDEKNSENLGVSSLSLESGLTEESISSFCKLQEIDMEEFLKNASVDNLTGDQLEALDSWKNVIADDKKGLLYYSRLVMMWMGIFIIIWAVLFYVGFWFDRTNNFLDFSVLSILTLGKLRISDTDDECTYGKPTDNNDGNKSKVKTVNHRVACMICVTSLTFGALIVSGVVYKLLQKLVYTILRFLY